MDHEISYQEIHRAVSVMRNLKIPTTSKPGERQTVVLRELLANDLTAETLVAVANMPRTMVYRFTEPKYEIAFGYEVELEQVPILVRNGFDLVRIDLRFKGQLVPLGFVVQYYDALLSPTKELLDTITEIQNTGMVVRIYQANRILSNTTLETREKCIEQGVIQMSSGLNLTVRNGGRLTVTGAENRTLPLFEIGCTAIEHRKWTDKTIKGKHCFYDRKRKAITELTDINFN